MKKILPLNIFITKKEFFESMNFYNRYEESKKLLFLTNRYRYWKLQPKKGHSYEKKNKKQSVFGFMLVKLCNYVYQFPSFFYSTIHLHSISIFTFFSSSIFSATRLYTQLCQSIEQLVGALFTFLAFFSFFSPLHCGLKCALGDSLGIIIISFPLHCSLWNKQCEKHLSAYFQMLWDYLYPILTHFYWVKSFMSLEYKRREFWENQVKITAKLSYI